tara:strand:+ start:106 stop:453 length:348 start_codon:yes stop_codon:yes gene_type:complete
MAKRKNRPTISNWTQAIFKRQIRKNKRGCWIWQRCRSTAGYGILRYDNRNWLAHRYAVLLFKLATPRKLDRSVVLHTCDNGHGGCVNPKHLQVGTQQENVTDMKRKGRMRHPKQQ